MLSRSAILCTISLLSFASTSQGAPFGFAEDNDLWKQDASFEKDGMTKDEFDLVLDASQEAYTDVAQEHGLSLKIHHSWNNSTVNAVSSRLLWMVNINMYGGLARRPEISRDGLAMVLCHELGHAFAGKPYASPLFKLSAEGMSDYYAAGKCMREVLPKIPVDTGTITSTEFTREKCREKHGQDIENYEICLRQLAAGQSLGDLLAAMKDVEKPSYQTPDHTVVSRTLTSYPDTIQCRLDTYLAGALEMPKPSCWFAE
jgi:hypothetical protein